MLKDSITKLIEEMQEVKIANQGLTLTDILKIFHIDATRKLANETGRLANNG